MNSANETLSAIKNKKAIITKAKNKAIKRIEAKYKEDMAILDKEEKELLKTFKDVPIEEIYKEEKSCSK